MFFTSDPGFGVANATPCLGILLHGGMQMLKTTRLHVPGMNSARTTRQVSDALVNVQGVADIGVDADRHIVEVKYDDGKTDKGAIEQAIRQAGVLVDE